MTDLIKAFLEAPGLLAMIYGDLGQPILKPIGSTIGTLLDYSTLWHLKIKLKNEKEKAIFHSQLEQYRKKIETIPEEELCEVNPQIGVPIFESLAYTTTEEIADLFTSLLMKASSNATLNEAHPAFVKVINSLSGDEAKLIKAIGNTHDIPWLTFRAYYTGGVYRDFFPKMTTIVKLVELDFPENEKMYISNLISLGIITDLAEELTDQTGYDEIKALYENNPLVDVVKQDEKFHTIQYQKGSFEITVFGRKFINAVIQQ